MSLIEKLENLSNTIEEYINTSLDESNTETFCVEPFIELLEFRRNPVDMQKQYPADLRGGNRAVDYALKKDGAPIMIVECKPLGAGDLDAWTGQLRDYFAAVREARFGVLTDGRLYRFYTDLDSLNLMDSDPFLEIDLSDIKPVLVDELERFTKSRFDVDKALAAAHNLKYSKAIRQFLMELLESPTADFITYVASEVNITINTSDQKQQVTEIVQQVLKDFKGEENPEFALPPDPVPDPAVELKLDETWIKKKIRRFTFEDKMYRATRWNIFLVKICEILSEDNTVQFEDVLQHMAHSFSRNPDVDFCRTANPKLIGSTGISVYTNMDNDRKKELLKELVEHFGRDMPVPHTD